MSEKYARLQAVTTMALNRSQRALGTVTAEIASLDQQIAALKAVAPAPPDFDNARAAATHARWKQQRLRLLRHLRTVKLAEAEKLRHATALASGRDSALLTVIAQEKAAAITRQRSRAERDGQVPDR
jgi:hypothetical protein